MNQHPDDSALLRMTYRCATSGNSMETGMLTLTRQGRVVCLLTVMFMLGSLVSATAEPSPACRAFAKQFAETPEKLSLDNLFRLQTCVRRELGQRGVDDPSEVQPPTPKYPRIPGVSPPPAGG